MQNTQNKDIRIVIVEDEAHNSRLLKGLIKELRPQWEIEATLESVEESVEWLHTNPIPQLILMDIQLSDGVCFSIFEKIDLPPSCRIIFTTAYDEFAIRAFKVNSIDYLLKPIEKDALEMAFLKFENILSFENPQVENSENYSALIHSILNGKKVYRTRFLIATLKGYHKLTIDEIAYFYSENKLTFAVDNEGNEHIIDYNLEQLEQELDPAIFFRANRKVILHIDAVNKISLEQGSKLKIILNPKPEFEVIVSRLKSSEFKTWMGK